jgi:hypothetical protein
MAMKTKATKLTPFLKTISAILIIAALMLNPAVCTLLAMDNPPASLEESSSPTPSDELSETPSPSDELSETPEPSDEPSETPSPSDELSETPEPSDDLSETPKPSDALSEAPEPSDGISETPAPSDELSETPEPSDELSETPEPSDDLSETPAPSDEPSETPAPSDEPSETPEPSDELSETPAPSDELSETPAPSDKLSETPEPSADELDVINMFLKTSNSSSPTILSYFPEPEIPEYMHIVQDDMDVTVPRELPFQIVLLKDGGGGFVTSDKFFITNNGEVNVRVLLADVQVHILNNDEFSLLSDPQLPMTGNSINMSLICKQNNLTERYVISESPADTYEYTLAPGESATFEFDGTVGEFGDIPWFTTNVVASVRFVLNSEISEAPLLDETVTPIEEPAGSDDLNDGNAGGITDDEDSEELSDNGTDEGDSGALSEDGSDEGDSGELSGDGSDNEDSEDLSGDGSDDEDSGELSGDGSDEGDSEDLSDDSSDEGDPGELAVTLKSS